MWSSSQHSLPASVEPAGSFSWVSASGFTAGVRRERSWVTTPLPLRTRQQVSKTVCDVLFLLRPTGCLCLWHTHLFLMKNDIVAKAFKISSVYLVYNCLLVYIVSSGNYIFNLNIFRKTETGFPAYSVPYWRCMFEKLMVEQKIHF